MNSNKWRVLLAFLLSVFFTLCTTNVSFADIVEESEVYTYEMLTEDIDELAETYPEIISYTSLGQTKYGRHIWAVKLGRAEPSVFINGSHHAREWISTTLNMEMLELYAKSYAANTSVEGYHVRSALEDMSIWFIPMVNPDGVTLQQKGLSAFPENTHADLIRMNDGSDDFTRWKANAEGIDLNRQYDAEWGIDADFSEPFWYGYAGATPFQTIENQAIREFTYRINPYIATSYHSSGRVLYWYFYNENLNRDERLARELSSITGYEFIGTDAAPSGKGYTDWFVQEFNRPAFTPELSYMVGDTHVPLEVFPEIWERNKSVGLWMVAEGQKIKQEEIIRKAALWTNKGAKGEIFHSFPYQTIQETPLYIKSTCQQKPKLCFFQMPSIQSELIPSYSW